MHALTITIPAGYSINPAYWTSTPGIVVATGSAGPLGLPADTAVTIETTATPGDFLVTVDGNSFTGTIVPPTDTTDGSVSGLYAGMPTGYWAEVTFIAGFFINPSAPGTYTWGPNLAYIVGALIDVNSVDITLVSCAVAGELVAVPKMTSLAALAPWFGLAVLVSIITAIGIERKKRQQV